LDVSVSLKLNEGLPNKYQNKSPEIRIIKANVISETMGPKNLKKG